jgi:superfamily II DNA or RNA helicase
MVGDGKNELGKVISEHTVVATIQTLTKRIEDGDQAVLDMLASRECVIVDEAHGIAATLDKGNQYNSLLKLLPNAYIRIGLTATPFMRDAYSNHLLEGSTGKVLVNIPARWLIDHGWLSDATITMVEVPPIPAQSFKAPLGKKTSRYQMAYVQAIETYDVRNQAILDRVRILPKPALVLVKTVAHADTLIYMAEKQGIHLPFIYGQTPSKERRKAVDRLVRTNGVLMATGIFDLGIDIPPLKGLILASGGKSQGQSLQRIGRGLRTWAGKSGLEVVDFYDLSQPLRSHSEGRKQLWKSEGYKVIIDETLV